MNKSYYSRCADCPRLAERQLAFDTAANREMATAGKDSGISPMAARHRIDAARIAMVAENHKLTDACDGIREETVTLVEPGKMGRLFGKKATEESVSICGSTYPSELSDPEKYLLQ